ncbi:MAG: glycosyltransferase family 2 protein [Lachnospiraceae bacterium]|nr:glycosyltransferase family 2 protein [Lachnospiraceae bacterium]
MKKVSLIVSVYNEEKGLRDFTRVTKEVLSGIPGYEFQVLFVNDGSTDKSGEILSELRSVDPDTVKVIEFSRNFGHEAAMCAGLDYADGDFLIFMDADLQHPPKCIPRILSAFENGAEVISMVRTENKDAGLIKNVTSGLFYGLINKLSTAHMEPGASDFFAMAKAPAEVLRHNFREKIRFLRGYVQNIGFNKVNISYEAAPRVAGESHYSIAKLWRLCINTIVCFSDVPLKAGIFAGLLSGLFGIILIIYTLATRQGAPGGYATIVIVLCFMFAVLFVLLGIIGQYIAVIYTELKDRPIYIIKDIR